jgi:hypothetical protein
VVTSRQGWVQVFVALAFALGAVALWGPSGEPPEKALEASTTAEPAAPLSLGPATGPGPYTAAQQAARVSLPPPTTAPDPLDGYQGRYACRFATAGRTTPCCPDAVPVLAEHWSGADLAVADYIIGRESGCNPAIVNTYGCVGWFQLCGKTCPGSCREAEPNAEEAFRLWTERGWCDWQLSGDPVTGRSCA